MEDTDIQKPVINCHTHIFTGNNVPPFLAKTYLPFFLYWLVPLNMIVGVFRLWYSKYGPYRWRFFPLSKKLARMLYLIKVTSKRLLLLSLIYWVLGLWITVQVFHVIIRLFSIENSFPAFFRRLLGYLIDNDILLEKPGTVWSIILILVLWLVFPTGRNVLLFFFKKIWSILNILPGKSTKELVSRYLTIGRYAFYKRQADVFQKLRFQYPTGTKFVVLPMDMEYMDAGKVKQSYYEQLEEVNALKKLYPEILLPFIAIDPRRIKEDPKFFVYSLIGDKVVLGDCIIRTYMEKSGFIGFKIYPALGYYPFDEALLPLWRYAAENSIPIMTHCIRGTIFYRGKKKKEWDRHPIFKQMEGNVEKPLLLPELENKDFTVNFINPLNYLCLLEEELLRKVLGQKDIEVRTRQLFGYKDDQTPLSMDLSNLKICFAHFGGEDEWERYFELDRDNFSTQVLKNPEVGITFLKSSNGVDTPGKIELLWKGTDWYSIICSMMLQFENVYSDISYIAHDNHIHALLKRTLQKENTKLRQRVLFGSDFYVVRNHKSEKQIMADTIGGLTKEEFDLIARTNPLTFLNL